MWSTFALCALIAVALLYLPGIPLGRGMGLDRALAICFAPVVSIALYVGLAVLYGFASIPCSIATVFIPALVIAFAAWAIGRKAGLVKSRRTTMVSRVDWLILGAYLLVGCLITLYVFVRSLDGAASYQCTNDATSHFNMIRAAMDSGVWSPLLTTHYPDTPTTVASNLNDGFYPAAWHEVVAMVGLLAKCEVAVAVNAVNAVFAGVVFPLSSFAMMRSLFPEQKTVLLCGAFATMAFVAYPWILIIKGALLANAAVEALIPAVVAVFVTLVKAPVPRRNIPAIVILGALAFITLALTQTNGLFTLFVFIVPYLLHIIRPAIRNCGSNGRRNCILFTACFIMGAAIVWLIAYNLPPLYPTTHYGNNEKVALSWVSSIFDAFSFGFYESLPQFLLAGVAALGVVVLVARKRSWLVVPGIYFLLAYIPTKATTAAWKNIFSGFWYSDPWRLAANAAVFLIPAVSVGLATLAKWLGRAITSLTRFDGMRDASLGRRATICGLVAVLLVFGTINYFPNYTYSYKWAEVQTPFGLVKKRISDYYSTKKDKVYSTEEHEFVEKALDVIPEGSLVLNQPHDGSIFAYSLDGMNTYFRDRTPVNITEDAEVIRNSIDEIAENTDVQKAVSNTGGQYILLLNQGVPYEDGTWLPTYSKAKSEQWNGFNRISDQTPGLETVLADGDMRLYRIKDATSSN